MLRNLTATRLFCWLAALGLGPELAAFVWQFAWGPAALVCGGLLAAEVAWNGWVYWHRIDQVAKDPF